MNEVKASNKTSESSTEGGGYSGLMTADDKAKLETIAWNANKYVLPIAGEGLGGVKSSKTGTEENRNYNVEVNNDGTMKVNVPWTDTDTNTHSVTHLYVADNNNKNSNVAASNGNVYLNLFDDSTKRHSILLKGSNRTTVASTVENGTPTITVDTQVTLPGTLSNTSSDSYSYSVKGPATSQKKDGYFLKYDGTWGQVLPSYNIAIDKGKYLKIDDSGSLCWATINTTGGLV